MNYSVKTSFVMKNIFFLSFVILFSCCCFSQNNWQQRVEYEMKIDLDVDTFVFDGMTVIAAGSGLNEMASAVDAAQYANWTTSVSTAVVTFTSRTSRGDLEVDTTEAVCNRTPDSILKIAVLPDPIS